MKSNKPDPMKMALADAVWRGLGERFDVAELPRIRALIDVWCGRRRAHPRPQQLVIDDFFMPGLVNDTPWFETNLFQAAARFEANHEQLKRELHALREHTPAPAYPGPGWNHWRVFELYDPRKGPTKLCELAPVAASILEELLKDSPHIQQFCFLALSPRSRLPVHADIANFLVSCHLGVEVPENSGLVVAGEARALQEGHCYCFNNSYLHSAYNDSERDRWVLAVHQTHPELTPVEKLAIKVIFELARNLRVNPSATAQASDLAG